MARKIKAVEYSEEYRTSCLSSEAQKENNDCAVVAVAVATGTPYNEVHRLMKENGRKEGRGTFTNITKATLAALGYDMKTVRMRDYIDRYPGNHKNLKSVTSHHPRRFNEVWADGNTYLFQSNAHIWAVVNGQNHDWSINRALRVIDICKIVKL